MNLYNLNNIDYGECYSVMASSVEEAIDAVIKRLEEINSTFTIEYFTFKNNTEIKITKYHKENEYVESDYFKINVLKAGEVLITEWA